MKLCVVIGLALLVFIPTTMHHRKVQQIKAYSKIIKYKKKSGEVEEVVLHQEEKPELH